jgi:hypothetical protein
MSDERIGLAYIGRTLQRLSDEVASLRDDVRVLTAIVQRHARLLSEIRAPHSQVGRLGDRVRRLEATEGNEK